MNEVRVNPTPVRTSENYQINDLVLSNISFAKSQSFSAIAWEDWDEKSIREFQEREEYALTYGNGKEAEKQVKQQANVVKRFVFQQSSEKENRIHFAMDDENPVLVEDLKIVVQPYCQGKVTILYTSDYTNSKAPGWHNGILRTQMQEGASLEVTVVNLLNESTTHLLAIENVLEKDAKLIYRTVDLGGEHSITNYYTNLKGDNATNILHSIYLGTGKQVLDYNNIAATYGKNTKMEMDVQGALQGESKKHFKGTIDFKRGGKGAVGNENEFCMLLSDTAHSISLPMLLCEEEDIVGNHAAAAGKIEEKELFYLMSRGFSEKEAKTLLVKAKMNLVLGQIHEETLQKRIEEAINQKLETEGL